MFTIPNEADVGVHANQSEPDSVDFGILTAAHALSGVVSGCAVTAQGTPDMTVAVAVGIVAVAGVEVAVSAGNVTITAADATNPRFDLIVVDDAGAKSAVAGTAAANPVYPAIPADSVVLAAVYVPANETAITAGHVVDKRVLFNFRAASGIDFPVGHYGVVGPSGTNTLALIVSRNFLVPWVFARPMSLDRVAIEVTTATDTATLKFIWYDSINGEPTNLLGSWDIAGITSTGVKEATIAISVSGGVRYFFGIGRSSTAGTNPVVRAVAANSPTFFGSIGTAAVSGNNYGGSWQKTSGGPEPNPFGGVATALEGPRLQLRRSA